MPDLLRKIPFSAELLPFVQDFDCGSEPWQTPLSEWIKAPVAIKNGAIGQLHKKKSQLQVWLHINAADELVGFSSLGPSNWKWPTPDDPRVPISIIPNVAIQKRFHGKPEEPPRYSKQMMDHLVFEARQHQDRHPLLGLYVDPRNTPAIKLYRREGFQDFQTYTDAVDGITYQGMILKLSDYLPHEAPARGA